MFPFPEGYQRLSVLYNLLTNLLTALDESYSDGSNRKMNDAASANAHSRS